MAAFRGDILRSSRQLWAIGIALCVVTLLGCGLAIWDLHRTETELEVRSYLALFDFREDEVFAPIAGLSGGEDRFDNHATFELRYSRYRRVDDKTGKPETWHGEVRAK